MVVLILVERLLVQTIVSAALLAAPAATCIACFGGSSSSSPTAIADSNDGSGRFEPDLAFCVDEVNRLRATVGKPPLKRSPALERYAATAVRHDAAKRKAHDYFESSHYGDGLVRGENEALGWSLAVFGSVREVIARSLAQMWQEGPRGDHYRNMTGEYTEIGCGIYVEGDAVSVAQAFR
jgi:uncharacterized protein YkwD